MGKRTPAGRHANGMVRPEAVNGTVPGGRRPKQGEQSLTTTAPQIGTLLRVLHEAVLLEPVPERFLTLLRQIDGQPVADGAPADPPKPGDRA